MLLVALWATSDERTRPRGGTAAGSGPGARRLGPVEEVAAALGGRTRIETIPTPADRVGGFFEAHLA